jgi:hypothetical protein
MIIDNCFHLAFCNTGTENVPLISGLGAASKIALDEFDELFVHLLTLKCAFLKGLKEAFNDKVCWILCVVMFILVLCEWCDVYCLLIKNVACFYI